MSRSLFAVAILSLLLVPASHLSAQSAGEAAAVLGAWEMSLETPRGSITQQLVFVSEGGELKGTASTPRGTSDLQDVTFEDGTLSFKVERNLRGRSMRQSFTATVEDGTLTGTISGGRGGDRPFTATRSST